MRISLRVCRRFAGASSGDRAALVQRRAVGYGSVFTSNEQIMQISDPSPLPPRKAVVKSPHGVVAAQSRVAAAAGAGVLARGGNAVDAAVAAGFAAGVVEPWMNGLGGGGFMVVAKADGSPPEVVDFSMIAPAALDPADYPLAGGTAQALFAWPAVKEDRNLKGYHSIAVPGQVDGMRLALDRFGSIGWRQALEPAIALAERGLPLDWYTTLSITVAARELAEFPVTGATYLPGGLPPVPPAGGAGYLPLGNLGRRHRWQPAGQIGRARDRELRQFARRDRDAEGRVPVQRQAALGQGDGRLQRLPPADAAESLERQPHAVDLAGHGDRVIALEVAILLDRGPGEQGLGGAAGERIVGRIERRRRDHREVDDLRRRAVGLRHHHEAAAAETVHPGLGDAGGKAGGHGRVDCVAAAGKHAGAGRGRHPALRGDDAMRRLHDRFSRRQRGGIGDLHDLLV